MYIVYAIISILAVLAYPFIHGSIVIQNIMQGNFEVAYIGFLAAVLIIGIVLCSILTYKKPLIGAMSFPISFAFFCLLIQFPFLWIVPIVALIYYGLKFASKNM